MTKKFNEFKEYLEKRAEQEALYREEKTGFEGQLKAIELGKADAKASGDFDILKRLSEREKEVSEKVSMLDDVLSVYDLATNPKTKLKVGNRELLEEIKAENTAAMGELKARHDAAAQKLQDTKKKYVKLLAEMSEIHRQSEILKDELIELSEYLPNEPGHVMPGVILNQLAFEGSLNTSYLNSEGESTHRSFSVWLVNAENLTELELAAFQDNFDIPRVPVKITNIKSLTTDEIQELAKC